MGLAVCIVYVNWTYFFKEFFSIFAQEATIIFKCHAVNQNKINSFQFYLLDTSRLERIFKPFIQVRSYTVVKAWLQKYFWKSDWSDNKHLLFVNFILNFDKN